MKPEFSRQIFEKRQM